MARSRRVTDRPATFALSSLPEWCRATTPAATHPTKLAPSFFVRLHASPPRLCHNGRPSRTLLSPSVSIPLAFTLVFCRPHASIQSSPRAVSVSVPAACYLASALFISIVRSATVYQYTESVSKRKLGKSKRDKEYGIVKNRKLDRNMS